MSLHEAAAKGDIDQVKSLISKGADVNSKESMGMTPLHYAALYGHKDMVEFLITKGADVNAKDLQGDTPVMSAIVGASANCKDVVQLLVTKGAQISAIHMAAYLGDVDKVRTLLNQGTDVNTKWAHGATPLHLAIVGGQSEVVKFLIDQGANVNAKSEEGVTLLHAALIYGDNEMVKLLIDKGADVKAADKGDIRLLETLMPSIMRTLELLEPGEDKEEAKRLWWESKKDDVKLVLARGGRIPTLIVALGASMGLRDMVELAIKEGEDVNARAPARQKKTLLHEAVDSGHKELVQYLLDKGADINAKERRGWTPLHMASAAGQREIVELLISKGAALNVGDIRGGTALWYAKEQGNKEIVELLRSRSAEEQAPTIPLHQAARDGDLEQVKSLVLRGADVNAIDDRLAGTPLHLAAYYGRHDVVQFLISKGANVNVQNKWNRTALDEAVDQNRSEIAEVLRTHGAKLGFSMEAGRAEPVKSLLESAASKFAIPERNLEIPEQMQSCAANLRKIYTAIKKYEKDKGTLPYWLSDLVPDYVNKEMLLCPHKPMVTGRLRHDPRLPCSYGYEFRMDRARVNFPGSHLGGVTMRDWKTAEMRLFGDVAPLIRCFGHGPKINLSVSGKIYLSQIVWATMFMPGYKQYEIFKLLEESSR
ncbi:MAG TPA: ankyrin repeat domain-containing protein [Sedimentisphaerales bacterium]|nr:ankyrin repeat domain-containing protein [Sedimentisphaerales bacterium]